MMELKDQPAVEERIHHEREHVAKAVQSPNCNLCMRQGSNAPRGSYTMHSSLTNSQMGKDDFVAPRGGTYGAQHIYKEQGQHLDEKQLNMNRYPHRSTDKGLAAANMHESLGAEPALQSHPMHSKNF